jgi:hypothetical protein
MTEYDLIVSWGFIVKAKNYDDAEKKAKAKLVELLGEEGFKKLDEAADELCISEPVEDEDTELE